MRCTPRAFSGPESTRVHPVDPLFTTHLGGHSNYGGCVGRCDGAVDLLGSPTTQINGATHSLIINQAGGAPGALQGTGVTDP